jgi:hypothetical protein
MQNYLQLRNLKLFIFLLLFISISYGQTSPTIKQESEKSTCSNIVALVGNINLNCSKLTPAQKKALEDIPTILRMALKNQDYLDSIKKELDEISQNPTQTTTTNSAPGGFAVSGGTLINPQVNNLRNPLPRIQVTESTPIPPPPLPDTDHPIYGKHGIKITNTPQNPSAFVILTLIDNFYNPSFVADCNVPCHFSSLLIMNNQGDFNPIGYIFDAQPLDGVHHMSAGVMYAKQLLPGVKVKLVFQSLDDRELTISNVRPYSF